MSSIKADSFVFPSCLKSHQEFSSCRSHVWMTFKPQLSLSRKFPSRLLWIFHRHQFSSDLLSLICKKTDWTFYSLKKNNHGWHSSVYCRHCQCFLNWDIKKCLNWEPPRPVLGRFSEAYIRLYVSLRPPCPQLCWYSPTLLNIKFQDLCESVSALKSSFWTSITLISVSETRDQQVPLFKATVHWKWPRALSAQVNVYKYHKGQQIQPLCMS